MPQAKDGKEREGADGKQAAAADPKAFDGLGNKGLLCLWDLSQPRSPAKSVLPFSAASPSAHGLAAGFCTATASRRAVV